MRGKKSFLVHSNKAFLQPLQKKLRKETSSTHDMHYATSAWLEKPARTVCNTRILSRSSTQARLMASATPRPWCHGDRVTVSSRLARMECWTIKEPFTEWMHHPVPQHWPCVWWRSGYFQLLMSRPAAVMSQLARFRHRSLRAFICKLKLTAVIQW